MAASEPREITVDTQTARIFEWRRGFNAMHLIDLGVRLGLFGAFAASPGATPREVAARLGLNAPYVETWCTTAHSFGLLEGDDDRKFRLAPHMDVLLANPAHPRYLGGYPLQSAGHFGSGIHLSISHSMSGALSCHWLLHQ